MVGRCIDSIGRGCLRLMQSTGELLRLLMEIIYACRQAPQNIRPIIYQMAMIGVDTLPIASVMAMFVGMVLALQTGYQLAEFYAEDYLGIIVGLSMVKELGPVLTGLLLAGRVGSAISAELGTMAVSEEIDALKTLGINPVRYLAMPRMIACMITLPVLVVYADVIGIVGGSIVAQAQVGVAPSVYFDHLFQHLNFAEISQGLVKSVFFGLIVALVGCYHGFKTTGGAQGVGRSTTYSVVMSFMLILISDYFITRIMLLL